MKILDVEISRIAVNETDDVLVIFGSIIILIIIAIIILRVIRNRNNKFN